MAVSKFDKRYLSEEDQNRIASLTDMAQRGQMDLNDAHNEVESIRKTAGYSGGVDGSSYIPLRDENGSLYGSAAKRSTAPKSTGSGYASLLSGGSKYDSTLEALAKEIVGMNYDTWTQGTSYADLAKRYSANGQKAMEDTLAQISARTGGLASSYAGTAAQQTYNDYMTKLEDAARAMYDAELGEKQNKASLLKSLSDTDYSRRQDVLAQLNADRNFGYTKERDAVADARYADELAYSRGRDSVADARYADETTYSRGRDALEDERYADNTAYTRGQAERTDARQRVQDYIATGRDPSRLDARLLELAGYTDEELAGLRAAAVEALVAQKKKSASSGSTKTQADDTEEGDVEGLFLAAQNAADSTKNSKNPTTAMEYIQKNYKNFGFSSAAGLLQQYRDEWTGDMLDMPQGDAYAFLEENGIPASAAISRDQFYANGKVVGKTKYASYYDYIQALVEHRAIDNTDLTTAGARNEKFGR